MGEGDLFNVSYPYCTVLYSYVARGSVLIPLLPRTGCPSRTAWEKERDTGDEQSATQRSGTPLNQPSIRDDAVLANQMPNLTSSADRRTIGYSTIPNACGSHWIWKLPGALGD